MNFSLGNSRIPYYVILGLDPRISIGNFRIPQNSSLRGVSETNDEAISFIKPFFDGIVNEIASVALLPRNDGILDGILNEILGSSWGMTQGLGILGFPKLKI